MHLIDNIIFLCQVSPAPDEVVVVADKLTFDLSMLHSLELLLVDSIDIHQLQGRSLLPGQIIALEIRRSLGSLKVHLHSTNIDCMTVVD